MEHIPCREYGQENTEQRYQAIFSVDETNDRASSDTGHPSKSLPPV